MRKKNNKKIMIFLLLIIIFGFTLRLYGISKESYWLDEAMSVKQAQQDLNQTVEILKNDIHLPLYTILLHFWVKSFGFSEFSTRSLSLSFGVISILLIFLIAKKMFSKKTAITSALLLSFSPLMIYYSQETRPYSLLIMLCLASYYFFVSYLEKYETKHLIYHLISSILLIYTHLFGFLIIISQNIFIIYLFRLKIRKYYHWSISQILLLASFMPWIPILRLQLTNNINMSWMVVPTKEVLIGTLTDFFGNPLIFTLFCVLFFFFLYQKKYRNLKTERLILLSSWFFAPFILVITYSLIFPSLYNTRYMMITLPPLLIAFCLMIEKISAKKTMQYSLVLIVVIASFFSIQKQVETIDKDDWRTVSDHIRNNTNPQEIIFINPFYHQEPFTYYYDSECFRKQDVPSCNFNKNRIISLNTNNNVGDETSVVSSNSRDQLKDYLNETIILISVRPHIYETNISLYDYFSERKKLTQTKEFGGGIIIYTFE